MSYFDKSFLSNPLLEYFKWLFKKIYYQTKYWGNHLRIGYMSKISNTGFGKYNWVMNDVIISNSTLGDFSYVSSRSVILETTMGKFCSIGPDVKIAPGKHPTHTFVSTHPAIFSNPAYCLKNFAPFDKHNPYRKVTIGNDVWVCANVVIADGVNIGDGAIIAAGSVVTRDVESFSIVGGAPAKHIRYRFTQSEMDCLLKNKWWDNDIAWLEKNAPSLWSINDYVSLTQAELIG